MSPLLVVLISLLITHHRVTAQTSLCQYGSFKVNPSSNECVFDCEHSNSNYKALSSLSFHFIASECSKITNGSSCPHCKCSSVSSSPMIHSFEAAVTRTCSNCSCELITTVDPITEAVAVCEHILSVNQPFNRNEFECAPNECREPGSDDEYKSGQYWWGRVPSGALCHSFRHRTRNGTTRCVSGFDGIVSSADDCSYNLEDVECLFFIFLFFILSMFWLVDSVRMNQIECSCPRCDCGAHSVGDSLHWLPIESRDHSTISKLSVERRGRSTYFFSATSNVYFAK